MPHCLITGASGFVGSNLVAHMENAGWAVRCLARPTSRTKHLASHTVQWVVGSLADRAILKRAVSGTDVVFHLAGRLQALRYEDFHRDNVLGTRNVAEACADQTRPPVMVFVSSLAAGGPATEQTPRVETDTDQPVSDYGRSKQAAEWAAATHASEVPLSVVRPPIVFGPADRTGLKLFRGVKRFHLHLVPGLLCFPVSVVHVGDLCEALLRVGTGGRRIPSMADRDENASGGMANGTYYVTSERAIDYREMGELAARALGTSTLVLSLPRFAFWTLGAMGETICQLVRRPHFVNLDKIREATASGWVCSDEKIRRELGYQPAASLAEQFAETARWYTEQHWL